MQNNADIWVFSGSLDKQKRKRMKQRRDAVPEIAVGRPNQAKKMLKRSFIDDDDEWGPPTKSKKPRPIPEPMIVDLTITDSDDYQPPPKISSSTLAPSQKTKIKVKPTPKPPISKIIPMPRPLKKSKFIHAKYDAETDVVTLFLEDIRPVPLEILTLNTRFLRQSIGNDVNASSAFAPVNINCTRQNGSRPCLSIIGNSSSTTDNSLEEVSVGGVVQEFAEEWVEKEIIELSSDSDVLKENLPQENVPFASASTPLPSSLKNPHQKMPRGPYIKRKPRNQPTGDDVNESSSTFKVPPPPPRAIPDTTEYRKTQYPKKKSREPQHGQEQQQPRKQKQTSGKDITIPVQVSPWSINKLTPTHPKKALDSHQLLQPSHNESSPVRPNSARSSLNGFQNLFEPDYFNGSMPSAKALGKRRAISPMSISATTAPTPHVPPYSPNIQMTTSLRSPSLTHNNNPYGLLNSDFDAFIDDPPTTTAISSTVQSSTSSAVEANKIGADSMKNTFSLSTSSYHPLDTLTSLYDQAAASSNQSEIIHIDLDSSRHTSATTHSSHVLAFELEPQSGSGSRGDSFFSSDFLNDDVGFSPVDDQQHGDQEQHRQQHNYDDHDTTTVDGGGVWSSSSLVVVGNQSEDQIYAYETIDPTLLGGGEAPLGDVES